VLLKKKKVPRSSFPRENSTGEFKDRPVLSPRVWESVLHKPASHDSRFLVAFKLADITCADFVYTRTDKRNISFVIIIDWNSLSNKRFIMDHFASLMWNSFSYTYPMIVLLSLLLQFAYIETYIFFYTFFFLFFFQNIVYHRSTVIRNAKTIYHTIYHMTILPF